MNVFGVSPDLGAAMAEHSFRIPHRQDRAVRHSGIDGENVNNVPKFMQQSK